MPALVETLMLHVTMLLQDALCCASATPGHHSFDSIVQLSTLSRELVLHRKGRLCGCVSGGGGEQDGGAVLWC